MPFIPYNTNIPGAPNNPSQDQGLMKENTNSINTLLEVDHFSFENNNGGYHKKSTYPVGADPGSVANQAVEYSKSVTYANAIGTFSELFFQRDGIAGSIQLTAAPGNPVISGNGQTFLPGGLILKFGQRPSGPGTTVAFPFPYPNGVISVVLTSFGGPAVMGVAGQYDRFGFGFQGNDQFNWIAIGY